MSIHSSGCTRCHTCSLAFFVSDPLCVSLCVFVKGYVCFSGRGGEEGEKSGRVLQVASGMGTCV